MTDSSLFNTRDIERAVLKILLTEFSTCIKNVNQVKVSWFTSDERKFVYELIKEFIPQKKLITNTLFEFTVNSKVDAHTVALHFTEWNLILETDITDDIDSLIELLKQSELARQVRDIELAVVSKLQAGEVYEAVDLLKSKTVALGSRHKDLPHINLTDYKERENLIYDKQKNPSKYSGIPTGFKYLDSKTGGFFPSELTVVSAVSGVGKSTLLKQFAYNIIKSGKSVLHVTNEESLRQVQLKYDSLVSGIFYYKFKKATITDTEVKAWKNKLNSLKYDGCGDLYIKEIPPFTSVLEIERTMYEIEQAEKRPDVIIIDYMDHLGPTVKSFSENDSDAKVAADVKGLSIAFDVSVVTATQSSTAAEEKQSKDKAFKKYDVYGSKRKVHTANLLMYVIQQGQDMSQLTKNGGDRDDIYQCDWFWKIQVAKNRDSSLLHFPAKQHVRTGFVEELDKDVVKSSAGNDAEIKNDIDDALNEV